MQAELIEVLAGEVALTIKTALGPVLERLAVAEAGVVRATVAASHAMAELAHLRDRVVVTETKATDALRPASVELTAAAIDVTPVIERLASAEARLAILGDVRDRVVAVETKAALPPDLGDVRDRLVAIEQGLAVPSPTDGDVKHLGESVSALVLRTAVQHDVVTKELGAMRERLAVLETRAPVPGPAGADGKDGRSGTDGTDGVGFDDLTVAQENDRTVIVRATKGDRVKDVGTVTFPVDIYRGVYLEGKNYERGDGVTWAGSEWHCHEPTTTKPGDGSKAWTLKVKRGRDGRDGRDAPGALPVVSVGGRG